MNNPSIYQINTRVVLQERGVALGRPATLDDLEDRFLDDIAGKGFQWVWFLGVWQTGPAGREISRSNPKLVEECRRVLPDLKVEDICGSPFAIVAYETHRDFGGDKALAHLRKRLAQRNLKLLLDFVPNHTAPDHPLGADAPGVLHPGERGRSGAAAAKLRAGEELAARRWSSPTAAIPTSTAGRTPSSSTIATPGFARHGSPSSDRSPSAATASAATWRCCCSRRSSRRPGATAHDRRTARRPRTTRSGPKPSPPSSGGTRSSSSSPRSTGTWSSRCNRRASTTPTTSVSTIASSPRPPRRCAST